MKRISQKQLNQLDNLYRNGQLDGSKINNWTMLSREDGNSLISKAENTPKQTYQPAEVIVKNFLLEQIRSNELVMQEELLRFIPLATAERLCWMFQSSNKNTEADLSNAQCRRIRILIAKGFLKHKALGEIKNLSRKAAEKLIEEGENNALKEN